MGSFNTTCFASQQTIGSGDSCYVIAIQQNASYAPIELHFGDTTVSRHGLTCSTCYPCAYWVPLSGFIEAEYTDGGDVLVKDTGHNRLRMMHLFRKLYNNAAVVHQGKNPYHDVPFDIKTYVAEKTNRVVALLDRSSQSENAKPTEFDSLYQEEVAVWDYVWRASSQHRLFIRVPHSHEVVAVQFAVIHKAAYDALIDTVSKQKKWDDKSLNQRAFFNDMFEQLLPEVDAYKPTDDADASATAVHSLTRALRDALGSFGKYEGISWDYEHDELTAIVSSYVYRKNVDAETLFEKVKPIMDTRYVTVGLDMHNIKFTPVVSTSQDSHNSVGRGYAKFVQQVSKVVTEQAKARG